MPRACRRGSIESWSSGSKPASGDRRVATAADLSFLTESTGSTENCLPSRDARTGTARVSIHNPKCFECSGGEIAALRLCALRARCEKHQERLTDAVL